MIRSSSREGGGERARLPPAQAPLEELEIPRSFASRDPELVGLGGADYTPNEPASGAGYSDPLAKVPVGAPVGGSPSGMRAPPPHSQDPLTIVMRIRHETAALLVAAQGSASGLDARKGRELIGAVCSVLGSRGSQVGSESRGVALTAWAVAIDTLLVFFELSSLRKDATKAFRSCRLSIPEMLETSRSFAPGPHVDPMVAVLRIARHVTDKPAQVKPALLNAALWITDQAKKADPHQSERWLWRQKHVVDAFAALGQAPLREHLASLLSDTRQEGTDRVLLACATLGRFAEILGAKESREALTRCIRAVPSDASHISEAGYNAQFVRGLAALQALLLDPKCPISTVLEGLPHLNPALSDRAVTCLIELTTGAMGAPRREIAVPVLQWWKQDGRGVDTDHEGRSLVALKILSQLDDSVLVPVFLGELTDSTAAGRSNGVRIRLCQSGLKRNAHHISANNLGALRELMESEALVLREIGAEVYALISDRLPGNLNSCRDLLYGRYGSMSPDLATSAVGALTRARRQEDVELLRDIYLSPKFPRHTRAAAQQGLRDLGEDTHQMPCEPDVLF